MFCGDGRVQVAKGSPAATNCSTGSLTCDALNADNIGSMYTGATTFNTTDSEGCEASDTQIQGQSTATVRDRLCKAKFGNRTFYDSGLTPSCNSDCTINDNGACLYCGDGTTTADKEDCDSNTSQYELCKLKFGDHPYHTTTNKPSCTVGTGTNACKTAGITNATANSTTATCAWCGDGYKNGGEGCDNGTSNTNSPTCTTYGGTCSYCNLACESKTVKGPYCGDGTRQSNEGCDGSQYSHSYSSCIRGQGTDGDDNCGSGCDKYDSKKWEICTRTGCSNCQEQWSCTPYTQQCSDYPTAYSQCDW